MKFKAEEVFADYDENDVLIIAFSGGTDDDGQPVYFIIQDSEEYDDQDQKLGMDTYYIEKNDQSTAGYGGVKEIRLDRDKVIVDLNQKGIEKLKETRIEIDFELNDESFENLRERLQKVFRIHFLKY